MDKRFLNELADKLENVQFLWEQVEKAPENERQDAVQVYEQEHGEFERFLFGWIEGLIKDPEPDEPEKTATYYRVMADKADEIAVLLADISEELTQCAQAWRNY